MIVSYLLGVPTELQTQGYFWIFSSHKTFLPGNSDPFMFLILTPFLFKCNILNLFIRCLDKKILHKILFNVPFFSYSVAWCRCIFFVSPEVELVLGSWQQLTLFGVEWQRVDRQRRHIAQGWQFVLWKRTRIFYKFKWLLFPLILC